MIILTINQGITQSCTEAPQRTTEKYDLSLCETLCLLCGSLCKISSRLLRVLRTTLRSRNDDVDVLPITDYRLPITAYCLLIICTLCVHAHADTFLWRQANTKMGTAVTPQEFAETATLYHSVIERGERTAAAYYNYSVSKH